jgi:hypothetical protein
VADRAGGDPVRGQQALVGRVDLAELHHDRSPGGEGGGVVEDQAGAGLAAVEQRELFEWHMFDDIERADVE